ncbi:MAG TPA: hypothetical protein VHC22_09290 [Pirellulales bacterium]|nr:hypothetical protein [Pirellulales bacterium]
MAKNLRVVDARPGAVPEKFGKLNASDKRQYQKRADYGHRGPP